MKKSNKQIKKSGKHQKNQHAPSEFKKLSRQQRRAQEKQKMREGKYDELPVDKRDNDWNYM